jgi:YegS/Rv2252/BmrU family lipid kinase
LRLFLIINPAAGSGAGERRGKEAVEVLQRSGFDVDAAISEYPGHIIEIAASAGHRSVDGIVAVGGDGTLFEMANGLLASGAEFPAVGVVPAGTGNSLAQDLGAVDFESAIDVIAAGSTRTIDLGRYECNGEHRYFVNVLGIGFVAAVAKQALRFRKLGQVSYALSVFLELARMRPYRLTMKVDGELVECENHFVEVCNSRYTAGNMLIAPQAELSDGFLDVVLLNSISRLGLVKAFPQVYSGEHLSHPHVEVYRCHRLTIQADPPQPLTPDGEVMGQTPLTIEALPSALKVFSR